MYKQKVKPRGSGNTAVANSVVQKKSVNQRLVYNRIEATVQKKIKKAITDSNIQRIKVGKDDVRTVSDLGQKMNLTEEQVIEKFNAALGSFPDATKAKINNFLSSKTAKVRTSITDHKSFFERLVISYKNKFMETQDPTFMDKMNSVESTDEYKILMNPKGINYGEGEDDGASITDTYEKTLACTLYALLKLKPNFMGAATPEQLHYFLRTDLKTKNYDQDPQVAQIRLAGGLTYKDPGTDLSGFMKGLDTSKKYIIDPRGAAHTFALVHDGSGWKQYDNDHPNGKTPSNTPIRVVWE